MMRVIRKTVQILLVLLVFVPLSSYAATVSWTFDNSVFNDGGTITGSFVYDADINDYSNVNIMTSAGSTFVGTTYNGDATSSSGSSLLILFESTAVDLTGSHALSLFFNSGLSNLGGLVTLFLSPPTAGTRENICNNSDCVSATGIRGLVSGSVNGTPVDISPVPAPPALLLFLTGILGMGFTRFNAWIKRR